MNGPTIPLDFLLKNLSFISDDDEEIFELVTEEKGKPKRRTSLIKNQETRSRRLSNCASTLIKLLSESPEGNNMKELEPYLQDNQEEETDEIMFL